MAQYSNFNRMVEMLESAMLGVKIVERHSPRNSAEVEEQERLDAEDQFDNWLQDEAPLPF